MRRIATYYSKWHGKAAVLTLLCLLFCSSIGVSQTITTTADTLTTNTVRH